MTWKYFLRRIVPPLLVDLHARVRHPAPSRYIWEGVYEHYRDVPKAGEGFSGAEWVASIQAALEHQVARQGATPTFPLGASGENRTLSLVGSVVCGETGKVTVLDFGGGAGGTFLPFISGMAGCDAVDYHVVDLPAVCAIGRRFWKDEPRLHFHDELPSGLPAVDIVHIDSALQYVEDYRGLLLRLCEYRPRFFLFVRLSAGDIPTYATAQRNVRGSTLPYWFINVGELIDLMAAAGYVLRFKEQLDREYNQDNFPARYRLGRTCNLLFANATA